MKNNKLILYKDNIFTKISNFFKMLFFRENTFVNGVAEVPNYNNENKKKFIDNIVIKENEEEKRLKSLMLQYDNGEIDEEEISDEDMNKLVEMYENETNELNADTEIRKNYIAKMIKELKNS